MNSLNEKYMAGAPPIKYMSVGADDNRNILRSFIHTYRDLPVLWDTTLRDYTNRDKRAEAYEQLVPIYRYLKRDATVEDVKKKINTLRTNYRKELKVVESAKRMGSMHNPRCWTFQELDFLRNTEKFLAVGMASGQNLTETLAFNENSSASTSNFMESPFTYASYHRQMAPPNITEMFQKSFGSHTPKLEQGVTPPSVQVGTNAQAQLNQHHAESASSSSGSSIVGAKRARISPSAHSPHPHSDELLNIACDYLSSTFPEEESIVRTWTHKLKRMQREQRLLAEKFINEILFEGESGTLHRGSVQVNTFEPFVRFEPTPQQQPSSDDIEKPQSPRVHTSTHTAVPSVVASTSSTTATPQQQAASSQYATSTATAPSEPEVKHLNVNAADGSSSYTNYN